MAQRKNKISIHNIESVVDPSTYLEAEELFDQKGIAKVSRLDPHLWVIHIKHKDAFEVEILLSKKGLLNGHSCDCPDNAKSKPCVHVITSLIHIRKNLKTPIANKVKLIVKPKKISVGNLIQHITSTEIEDFILTYAKKDKKFEHEFKLSFADRIITEDENQKYTLLLDQIFKTHLSHHNKISNASARYFHKIGSLLIEKIDELIAFENYTETVRIIFPLLRKSYVVLKKNNPNNEYLLKFILDLHVLCKEFIDLVHAPEIIHSIYAQVLSLADYSFHILLHPEHNIFTLLLQSEKFKTYHSDVIDRVNKYKDERSDQRSQSAQILALYYINGRHFDQVNRLFTDQSETTDLFIFVSNTLQAKQIDPKGLIQCLSTLDDYSWPTTLKIKRAKILISAYCQENLNQKALEFTLDSYRRLKQKSILDTYQPKKNPSLKIINEAILDIQGMSTTDQEYLYHYYGIRFLSGQRLLKFIQKHIKLEEVMTIEPAILLSKSVDIESLFKYKISEYLNEHYGEHSKDYIYSILRRIDLYQIDRLRSRLIDHIHEQFPGRMSLKNILY